MTTDDTNTPQSEGIRINKYLASCGFESRRKADQLIAEGAVEINGQRVETPGVRVMPGDFVKVNGKQATPKDEVAVLLNKPRGFVCSRDPQGAMGTVYDLLPAKYRFVNYVGRLDTDSEGLLVLTNKGALSQKLMHPSSGIEKEYWVTLNQPYDNSVLVQLLKGVRIPEGQAKAKFISRLSPRRACVVLEQGLKRQVRQMFACLGFRVRKLVRVRIGSLWGGDLAPGRAMILTAEQEKLACVNPTPRKGLISAAQVFPATGALSTEQIDKALDEKMARRALEEETDYIFNPADFETDEEAGDMPFRHWEDEEKETLPWDNERRRPRKGATRARDERFTPHDRESRRRTGGYERPSHRENAYGKQRASSRGYDRSERQYSYQSERPARRSFGEDSRRERRENSRRNDFENRRSAQNGDSAFRHDRAPRRGNDRWGSKSGSRNERPTRRGDRHGSFGAPRRRTSSAPRPGKRFR